MRELFYYKIRQKFIANASGFLLQNATVITNRDDFNYKMRHLLQMPRLLQIATVRSFYLFLPLN